MRDAIIIAVVCVAAVAAGAWLFFTNAGNPLTPSSNGPVAFTVVIEGEQSGGVTERKNYRVKSLEDVDELWRFVFGTSGPAIPPVDFSTEELLAVFDGTHSSGGYRIDVLSVEDTASARIITIKHVEPGASCITTSAITSPFQIVQLPKTTLPITREDVTEVRECE
ncbi:protease complex subunit PrcB family protein [Candidatus Parcubacteria bacterium]|nr:protease complex subunit PrcB family protein [Candidatus Parcubacteria bacterium]